MLVVSYLEYIGARVNFRQIQNCTHWRARMHQEGRFCRKRLRRKTADNSTIPLRKPLLITNDMIPVELQAATLDNLAADTRFFSGIRSTAQSTLVDRLHACNLLLCLLVSLALLYTRVSD